jgi:predicted HNH restriction endonuclease
MPLNLALAEKVAFAGVRREARWLYYIDTNGNISRTRSSRRELPGVPELVAETNVTRDPKFVYFMDDDGDVVRVPRDQPIQFSVADYRRAFEYVLEDISGEQEAMLTCLLAADANGVSQTEAIAATGLQGIRVNAAIGAIGNAVYEFFDFAPDIEEQSWPAFTLGRHVDGRGFVWTLRAEARDALGVLLDRGSRPARAKDDVAGLDPADSQSQHATRERVRQSTAVRRGQAKERPEGVSVPIATTVATRAFARDARVAQWVRKRAAGKCECCHAPAPFVDESGIPFLEVHHLVRLADGGPDTVENSTAVCPNCHRRLHHARDRAALTKQVAERIFAIERART